MYVSFPLFAQYARGPALVTWGTPSTWRTNTVMVPTSHWPCAHLTVPSDKSISKLVCIFSLFATFVPVTWGTPST